MRMLESRLQREWDQVVGPQLAAHTWPDSVKFKKLILLAENSVWLQQLVFLKPALLEKIHVIPQGYHISDIVLRVGEIPIQDSSLTNYTQYDDGLPSQLSASNKDLSFAMAITSSIKNPELQTLLRTVIAKALSFKKVLIPSGTTTELILQSFAPIFKKRTSKKPMAISQRATRLALSNRPHPSFLTLRVYLKPSSNG